MFDNSLYVSVHILYAVCNINNLNLQVREPDEASLIQETSAHTLDSSVTLDPGV